MSTNRIHVAVVDDDHSFGQAISRMLRVAGFDVDVYASAEAFLVPALSLPDCLVLDIQLAGMSGLELTRRLAAQGSRTPVIFVTALDEPALRDAARDAGCSQFFRKPVPGKLLVDAIHDAVERPDH